MSPTPAHPASRRLAPWRLGAAVLAGAVAVGGPALAAAPASAATPRPYSAADDVTAVTSGPATGLTIDEVESNGDDHDWVELSNTSTAAIDVSGWGFVDDSDGHDLYRLPAGSVVEPGGHFVVDQITTTDPGFDFGLGAPDAVRFFDTADVLQLQYSWTDHSAVTYGRCPDASGPITTTTRSTRGAANDCSSPVRINEVESDGGSPDDWVELTNTGTATVDVSGFVLTDSDVDDPTHRYTLPAGSTIAAGGYLVLDTASDAVPTGFPFGLGKTDAVHLFAPDGTTEVDAHSWTAHAPTTYGRNPDGTGAWETTAKPTKGAANVFPGQVEVTAWPGASTETALDEEDTFTGDLSGIDWEPSTTPGADGTLWAVQNGDGLLYRIVSDGQGGWAPDSDGWRLRYADGTGTPDAEGVTVADDSSAGGIYVSTERDNDVSGTSRPAVLHVTPTGSGSELRADREWNLAADFPGIGANAGLEGITWISDTFLTAGGFVDEHTGAAYDPADYAGHGDGLFFVGVEGTASVYAYALMTDGSFQRVATIETPFSVVADVQFDAGLDALWVVCDDACSGRTALATLQDGAFTIDTVYAAPADTDTTLANEGFAIADTSTCTDGSRATYYADDNDTDGFSLRTGTYPCAPGEGTPAPGQPGDGEPTPGPGTGEPTPGPGTGEPTPTPTPGPGPGTPSPTPGPGAGQPAPVVPLPADQLTAANRGSVTAPATVRAGQSVTISVGREHAGERVSVYLYSEARLLGTPTVADDGTVTVTIPADVTPGSHRLAVYAADGTLLGWTGVTVTGSGQLASTGAEVAPFAAIGGLLLLGGAVLLVLRRRRAVA